MLGCSGPIHPIIPAAEQPCTSSPAAITWLRLWKFDFVYDHASHLCLQKQKKSEPLFPNIIHCWTNVSNKKTTVQRGSLRVALRLRTPYGAMLGAKNVKKHCKIKQNGSLRVALRLRKVVTGSVTVKNCWKTIGFIAKTHIWAGRSLRVALRLGQNLPLKMLFHFKLQAQTFFLFLILRFRFDSILDFKLRAEGAFGNNQSTPGLLCT